MEQALVGKIPDATLDKLLPNIELTVHHFLLLSRGQDPSAPYRKRQIQPNEIRQSEIDLAHQRQVGANVEGLQYKFDGQGQQVAHEATGEDPMAAYIAKAREQNQPQRAPRQHRPLVIPADE